MPRGREFTDDEGARGRQKKKKMKNNRRSAGRAGMLARWSRRTTTETKPDEPGPNSSDEPEPNVPDEPGPNAMMEADDEAMAPMAPDTPQQLVDDQNWNQIDEAGPSTGPMRAEEVTGTPKKPVRHVIIDEDEEEQPASPWLPKLVRMSMFNRHCRNCRCFNKLPTPRELVLMAEVRRLRRELEAAKRSLANVPPEYRLVSPNLSDSSMLRIAKQHPLPKGLPKDCIARLQKKQRHQAGLERTPRKRPPPPQPKQQLSPGSDFRATHALPFKQRLALNKQFRQSGVMVMASKRKAAAFRQTIKGRVTWTVVNGPQAHQQHKRVAMICSNLRDLLEWRANRLHCGEQFRDGRGHVRLLLSGDKGGDFTKICVSFVDVKRLSLSRDNLSLIGLYQGPDSRALLAHYMYELFGQIENLAVLTIGEKNLEVEWFVTGDLAFMANMIGHYGTFNGRYRSPICEATLADFDEATPNCPVRSLETIQAAAAVCAAHPKVKGKQQTELFCQTKGIRSAPLLAIPLSHFVPSPFHCVQGIGNRLIDEFENLDAPECIAQMLQLFANAGARREQFRKSDYNGNAIRCILARAPQIDACFTEADPEVREKASILAGMMRQLAVIQTNLKAAELCEQETHNLQHAINTFFDFAKWALPDLCKIPKLHLLASHFMQFVRQHGTIGLMSEQGIEAMHSVVNSDLEKWKNMGEKAKMREFLTQSLFRNYSFDSGD